MMYLHFCKTCSRIHILNGHKQTCPKCKHSLMELQISYLEYTACSEKERTHILNQCQTEENLKKLSTIYRMQKRSK